MVRKLFTKKTLGMSNKIELFIELVYIVTKIRSVVVRRLLFSVVGKFSDRIKLLLGLAVTSRHCADCADHTASHSAAGSDKTAYCCDPQRVV